MKPLLTAGVLAVLLTVACDGGGRTGPTASTMPSAAAGCGEAAAREVVEAFFQAFNDGQAQWADRFFAEVDRFQWYSDEPSRVTNALDPTGPADPYDRSTLDAYLAQRYREGDRLTLETLGDVHFRPADATLSFSMAVRRPAGRSMGKATLDCRTRRLMVVSLGRPGADAGEDAGGNAGQRLPVHG